MKAKVEMMKVEFDSAEAVAFSSRSVSISLAYHETNFASSNCFSVFDDFAVWNQKEAVLGFSLVFSKGLLSQYAIPFALANAPDAP
jgi:hypothetical protein